MTLTDHRGNFITPPLAGATRYEYDWFSGSQISIMVGDVVLDSAVAIQFDVNQSKTPVYGYASQYYSFVSEGKVLVQGSLTIGFKESGYLLWPIKRFADLNRSNQWTSPRYSVDKQGRIIRGYDPSTSDGTFKSAAQEAERKRVMQANVEQMMEWGNPSASDLKNGAAYNSFWRQLGALPDDQFEDWAETFEDAIWYGSDPRNAVLRDQLFSGNIHDSVMGFSAGEIDEETVLSHRRADQYPPIDIWIVYGDTSRPAANHTVKKILDLSFIGQSQVIEVSGEPTYEQYTFIARNLA